MISLYIKNLIFFILQPGCVVGLLPYMLLGNRLASILEKDLGFLSYMGIVAIILGIAIVLYCIYRFIIEGSGTLSPAQPTKALVIKGLYRYTRNPMYVGIVVTLMGEVLFTGSMWLLVYSIVVALGFHFFVIFIEEPRLTRDFKTDYLQYTNKVKRWF